MGGYADLEIRYALQARHQLRRTGIALRVSCISPAARRIAAQGHYMAHARLPVPPRHLIYLPATRTHAGEMSGGGQAETLLDGGNGLMSTCAGGPAGTVG